MKDKPYSLSLHDAYLLAHHFTRYGTGQALLALPFQGPFTWPRPDLDLTKTTKGMVGESTKGVGESTEGLGESTVEDPGRDSPRSSTVRPEALERHISRGRSEEVPTTRP